MKKNLKRFTVKPLLSVQSPQLKPVTTGKREGRENILKTFSNTPFPFTADVKPLFDVWRLLFEVQSILHSTLRQVIGNLASI